MTHATPEFPTAAHALTADTQLRFNLRRATSTIRAKRARVVGEVENWQELRVAASRIKEHTMRHLDTYLAQFEEACTRAGGVVHWARDAAEANRIIVGLVQARQQPEVIKVKTMTSHETGLNEALEAAGIEPIETDLADLIVQLGNDHPSHIVVPALHKNRLQIRALFAAKLGMEHLGERPQDLAEAARTYLRQKFLQVPIAISGANFAVAETGSLCVVESEGNGRMCTTLPRVLISLVGIEKMIPAFRDLEVFLQLLARSATGERMNPYTSIWTGVTDKDGPAEFHVVLLDNGRTGILADREASQTLHCIRCGACLNICPVYRQTGGQAYGSAYSGPIGAILNPQLDSSSSAQSLPYASSLCGACYEVCPVRINIPEVLIHLREKAVANGASGWGERLGMRAAAFALGDSGRLRTAQRLVRIAQKPFQKDDVLTGLPGILGAWTDVRDLPAVPKQSFREWWLASGRK